MGGRKDRSRECLGLAIIAALSSSLLAAIVGAQQTDRSGVMERPPGSGSDVATLSLHSVEVSPTRAPVDTPRWLVFEVTASDPAAGARRLPVVFSYSIMEGRETVFSSEKTELQVTAGKRTVMSRELKAGKAGSFTLLAKVAYGALEKTVAAGFHVESAEQERLEAPEPVSAFQSRNDHHADVSPTTSATRPQPPSGDSRKTTIYLIRKKKLLGSAIRDQVTLDGQAWGQLRSGSYLEAHVAPGSHLIHIGGPNHRESFQFSQRLDLEPNQVLFLFRNWGASGANTKPIEQSEAASFLKKYKLAGRFQGAPTQ